MKPRIKISHSAKFIFIHNYKVAGTSITNALRPYLEKKPPLIELLKRILFKVYLKFNIKSRRNLHPTADVVRSHVEPKIFNSYFKFGFVRNPWDWQISQYYYTLNNPRHKFNKKVVSLGSFENYLLWKDEVGFDTQKPFFYSGNECLVDFIGKYESLEEDFKTVCEKIGVNVTLPKLNVSKHSHYLSYYNEKLLDIVWKNSKEDCELFGYQKPKL